MGGKRNQKHKNRMQETCIWQVHDKRTCVSGIPQVQNQSTADHVAIEKMNSALGSNNKSIKSKWMEVS